MGTLWIALVALAASPRPALVQAAAESLPGELDGAVVEDLATGELLLLHHPAVLARAYPPGSTLKLIAAYAALHAGGEAASFRYRCEGHAAVLGRARHCWVPKGHGELDLDHALAESCNLYFYELGTRLKPAEWVSAARTFGLGQTTGAPVEGESAGELPSAPSPAELSDAAAGEGAHLRVTPLQMLGIATAIATGGERLRPSAPGQPRQVASRIDGPASLHRLADDLRRAVASGTLAGSGLEALGVAGKTGTARWARGYHTHGWFLGFAPREAPRYAVVVFVNRGGGAADAGRAALALFQALLPPPQAPARTVRVRVLEKRHPHQLTAHFAAGGTARCDGESIQGSSFNLRIEGPKVAVQSPEAEGESSCQRVELMGRVVVTPPLAPPPSGEGERSSRFSSSAHPSPADVFGPQSESRTTTSSSALPLPKGEGPREGSYPGTLTITAHGELQLVDELGLEEYVAAVVDAEAESRTPAALEAQAIVSRTFAVREARRHGAEYDFCDLTHCQSFRGLPIAADAERATVATQGQVLEEEGHPIHAYFHSTCGGHTASAADVLGDPPDRALVGVSDLDELGKPWCAASPHLTWSFEVDRAKLLTALEAPDPSEGLRILDHDAWGTVLHLRAFGATLSGEAFKSRVNRRFGWQSLQSTRFELEERDGHFTFRGSGLGHRVGLCQFGAAAQAAAGWSVERILSHYFPGASIASVDGDGDRMRP